MSLPPQSLAAAMKVLEQHQRLLVTPHANVDPDGLSSALACYQMFQALGKDVTVVCPDTLPESLDFLPGFEKLTREVKESQDFVITINLDKGVEIDKLRYNVEDHRVNIIVVPKKGVIRSQHLSFAEGERPYDLLVVVDTADLTLLGSLYTEHVDLFSSIPIFNIDHHISNTQFGQVALIDPTAASATEVLYSWWSQTPLMQGKLTPDIATLLLTGLITDTRSFQNPNTTPRSLEVAAELLERGARQQEIIQHIYKTKPLSTLKIWGRALNRIQVDREAKIVWSAIAREDLQEMGASSKETNGILDELISTIPDADVHVLFTELEEGGLKASMRSSAAIDASDLAAKTFGGGGHARAAGFRVTQFPNFSLQVVACVEALKAGMRRQREQQESEPKEALNNSKRVMVSPDESMARGNVPSAASPEPGRKVRAQDDTPTKAAAPSLDVVKDLTAGTAPGEMQKGETKDIVEGLTGGQQKE